MQLSNEQELFLKQYKIPLKYVYDATWVRPRDFKVIMKELWMIAAIWVSPCKHWHDSIRTKDNQCLFCNPACLSFSTRTKNHAYVYVAWSIKWNILKVWYTEDIKDRKEHLNNNKYWWLNDWEILYKWKYLNAWEVENYLHRELKKYLKNVKYSDWGKESICYELFECSFSEIRHKIDYMNENVYSVTEEYYLPLAWIKYNFDDVSSNNKRIWNIKIK